MNTAVWQRLHVLITSVPLTPNVMGRGAVIPLDARATDEVWILANNHPVARGEIQINDDKISIAVTRAADIYDFMAGGN